MPVLVEQPFSILVHGLCGVEVQIMECAQQTGVQQQVLNKPHGVCKPRACLWRHNMIRTETGVLVRHHVVVAICGSKKLRNPLAV